MTYREWFSSSLYTYVYGLTRPMRCLHISTFSPVKHLHRNNQNCITEIRPIYTTENVWHGSDKNGTRTKKYSTDTSFTHPFFCHEITFWFGCRAQVFGKSWFGSANRLHYKFYPSRVSISGTRTNFTRARTTFSVGPSTGEILIRHG